MKITKSAGVFTAVIAATALILGVTSCDKDLLKLNIPMEFTEVTFTIPITPLAGAYADSTSIATNLDSLLATKNVKSSNIKSIKIETLTVTVLDGDALNNFRLLESIKGEISKDGGSYTTVGEVTGNPDVEKYEMSIPVNTSTEYKDYLNGSNFTFKVSGFTRGPVTKVMTVKAKLKFDLEATL